MKIFIRVLKICFISPCATGFGLHMLCWHRLVQQCDKRKYLVQRSYFFNHFEIDIKIEFDVFKRPEAPPVGLGKQWGAGDVSGSGATAWKGTTMYQLPVGIFAVSIWSHSLLHSAGTPLLNNSVNPTIVQYQPHATYRQSRKVVDQLQVINIATSTIFAITFGCYWFLSQRATIRYDTIEESLTWTRKLSIQLNLAHVARN